jgi:hypothetical protein
MRPREACGPVTATMGSGWVWLDVSALPLTR